MTVNYFKNPSIPLLGKVPEYLPHDARRLAYRLLSPSVDRGAKALEREMASFIRTRSIFVHIPKAAGISIAQSLYEGSACFHVTSSWYSLALSRQQIRQFFVFSIVRNPWDRLHSAYHFLQNGGFNEGDRYLWDRYLKKYKDFRDFVMDLPNAKFALANIVHLYPMHHFIELRPGRNILSYFGYYEDLPRAYSHIAAHVSGGANLQHHNKNNLKKRSYQSSYNDKMIDVVGEIYGRDISLFGYTFDSFDRGRAQIKLDHRMQGVPQAF